MVLFGFGPSSWIISSGSRTSAPQAERLSRKQGDFEDDNSVNQQCASAAGRGVREKNRFRLVVIVSTVFRLTI